MKNPLKNDKVYSVWTIRDKEDRSRDQKLGNVQSNNYENAVDAAKRVYGKFDYLVVEGPVR